MIDRMVFTAAAAARNATTQLAVTTNNLANAGTPGFREQLSAFRAVPVLGDGARTRVSSVDTTPGYASAPGRMEPTGNPYDLALEGDGWFTVRRGDGSLAHTRAGRFVVDGSGVLRMGGGAVVQGEDGELRLPPGTVPEVGGDGMVYARIEGQASGVPVGRLRLVRGDPGALDRGADGLYEARTRLPPVAEGQVRVRQGMAEMSNVSVADAMVQMISQTRLFELSMQFVRNADQNAQRANQLIASGR